MQTRPAVHVWPGGILHIERPAHGPWSYRRTAANESEIKDHYPDGQGDLLRAGHNVGGVAVGHLIT